MKNVICFLLLCLSLTALNGQGWERLYPLSQYHYAGFWDMMPTPDGGFLINAREQYNPPPFAGTTYVNSFYKIAADGTSQWLKTQEEVLGAQAVAMWPGGSNRMIFATLSNDTVRLVKTDGNFQPVWSVVLDSAQELIGPYRTELRIVTGGYALVYQRTAEQGHPVRVIKTDLNGTLLWQHDFTLASNFSFRDLVTDEQGNLYVFGEGGLPYAAMMGKISPAGNLLFTQGYPAAPTAISPVLINDNLLAFLDFANKLQLIDASGQPVNTVDLNNLFIYHMTATKDGNLLLGDQAFVPSRLHKVTPSGTILWSHGYDNVNASYDKAPHVMLALPDGGYAAFYIHSGGTRPYYVLRTDANGLVYTSHVRGHVFADPDDDCADTPGVDFPAPAVNIIAQEGNNYYYATTDSFGNYDLTLDTGTYLLRVLPPGGAWQACSDSLVVTLGAYDTLVWNTGINSLIECPWPGVSLSAPFLRRCFTNDYHVAYSNSSDVTADSAVVTLTLDPLLALQSASIPYTSLGGNVFQFPVGDLSPLETGSFSLQVTVDCSAELGQTHCSTAEINIANPCPEGAGEPVLQVNATCEGDSVAFRIRNESNVGMMNAAGFVIIEDLIVMRQGQFQLPAQEETVIRCPANGSTSRIYAGQAPGEPPFFATTTAIEGCNGPLQPGFWNMYPDLFVRQDADRDCQPNIGSFDPNDKQAVPTGYGAEHYIGRGVPLDYKIRFQNTGTDTAFTVVVRDTLSAWLDATSVRPGAASHPYTWRLLGEGVVEFHFENIRLPDSTTNLAGSQGFLTFHIDQKQDVPLQTLIENRAGIFFDFNAPVLTNTTFHRVGEEFVVVSAWEPEDAAVLIRATPNPFTAETHIAVQGQHEKGTLSLQIFDLQGKIAGEQRSENGAFSVKRGDLRAGVYLFSITRNGRSVGRGKLMVQ